MRRLFIVLLALAAGGAACSPAGVFIDPTGKGCDLGDPCPTGWLCTNGRCESATLTDAGPPDAGQRRDGGLDAGIDAGIDGGLGDGGLDGGPDGGSVGCLIGGQAYASGQTNPANGCQGCEPASAASAWTNLANGSPCGLGEICSSGGCESACAIGGTIYPAGTLEPGSPCDSCQPSFATGSWFPVADGTACGGGKICAQHLCRAGCFIGGAFYDPAGSAPGVPCQSCQPSVSLSAWTDLADGTSCGATDGGMDGGAAGDGGGGTICLAGSCTTGCDIGNQLVASDAPNPTNGCLLCDQAQSFSNWSRAPDGQQCDAGQICSSGVCASDCDIFNNIVPVGTPNPTNGCQLCTPSLSSSNWSRAPDGQACAAGEICSSGFCASDCDIGGAIYSSGAVEATDPCHVCQPATSVSFWTNSPDGKACGSGEICTAGNCSPGCYISNAFYPPATPEPGVPCGVCQPSVTTLGWSDQPDGTSCGSGLICESGVCKSNCYIGGQYLSAGALDPTDACLVCQPTSSTSSGTSEPNGQSCGSGDVCSGGSCSAGCYIGGAFYAPNAADPQNPCLGCETASSTSSWQPVPNGQSCGAGLSCQAGRCGCTSGFLTCGGVTRDSCTDSLNCGACFNSCSPGASGCFGGLCTLPALMPHPRWGLSAVLGADQRIYAIGGSDAGDLSVISATVEAYDPRTNLWSVAPSMKKGRVEFSAAADSDGGLYAFTGYGVNPNTGAFIDLPSDEGYDFASGSWRFLAPPPNPVDGPATAVAGGQLFVMGGNSNGSNANSVQVYDLASGSWDAGAAFSVPASYMGGAATPNGTVYSLSGTNDYTTGLSYFQSLAPGAASWSPLTGIPSPRCRFSAIPNAQGTELFAIAGDNCATSGGVYQILNSVAVYSFGSGTWSVGATLPIAVEDYGGVLGADGRIYIMGGWASKATNFVQVYEPVNGQWLP